MERLLRLIWPFDYYPRLLTHVGTNDTARGDPEQIKGDYMALGSKVKRWREAQMVFSSTLPVKDKDPVRSRHILKISTWLHRCCCRSDFGFLNHGVNQGCFLDHSFCLNLNLPESHD